MSTGFVVDGYLSTTQPSRWRPGQVTLGRGGVLEKRISQEHASARVHTASVVDALVECVDHGADRALRSSPELRHHPRLELEEGRRNSGSSRPFPWMRFRLRHRTVVRQGRRQGQRAATWGTGRGSWRRKPDDAKRHSFTTFRSVEMRPTMPARTLFAGAGSFPAKRCLYHLDAQLSRVVAGRACKKIP
jgi:hypothetical protein